MPIRFAFSIALTLLAATAQAQSSLPPDSPEHCAGIASDLERLACYDTFYRLRPEDTHAADEAARAAAAALAARQAVEATATEPSIDEASGLQRRPRRWFAPGEPSDISEIVPLDDAVSILANAGRGSLLDSRWELAKDSKFGVFNLRAYKPIYALPMFWASRPNPQPHSSNPDNSITDPRHTQPFEGKFQLSFKTKIAENLFGDNGDLWGAYTQTSRWQMFNSGESRPFRETNYEPELMLVFRNRYHLAGWNGRMAAIGINHQSNGQGDPESRSWNRIIGTIGLDRDNWAFVLRPWWRIPEGSSDDNNPDIEDYIGRGDAMLVYRIGQHEIATIARHSLRGGDRSHGSLQMDWGFPLDGPLRGHIQVFSGYGESLIDYNHRSTYIGLGISLTEWF
ncbi:phospholipase A [Xanthomonadaceae bacterium JHOS43]|nr:phospholipase A [Xanthomonadaceae bacterium JHOS43]MCX7563033.1 phospholipase A [Xanthomonadaceae bacterium XH05]